MVICSVRQDSSQNLWVRLPEGVCHVFVALGLTQSDGSVQEGLALSVERLRAVDGAQALVSVDYAVLTSNTDGFGRSLNTFMGNVPARFKRHFDGIEVRGIPVADYTDASKMTALNTAIGVSPCALIRPGPVEIRFEILHQCSRQRNRTGDNADAYSRHSHYCSEYVRAFSL
ncbi:uncharacterized protein [Dermacentor andersoni]|uniref:uncharacterized protein n=1 Tax=Dermacentor andersoni TaxID=34620 RepID=UPI0024173D0A|nr:uncharacterized protein LOC129382578 [Dermacentor andersoni]